MRLITCEADLKVYQNDMGVTSSDIIFGETTSLPQSYPYFLCISEGGQTYNSQDIYSYGVFTVEHAWELILKDVAQTVRRKRF